MGKKFVIFCTIFILIFALTICACSVNEEIVHTTKSEQTQEQTSITTETTTEPENPDSAYARALDYFNNGNYADAKPIFEQLGDYENSKNFLIAADLMLDIQGFYEYRKDNHTFVFEIGKNVSVMNEDFEIKTYKSVSLETNNNEEKVIASDSFGTYAFVRRGNNVMFFSWGSTPTSRETADKYETLTKLPESYSFPTEPKIGMTADEVRKSTWGEPQKINTTITTNGTSEQWCYSNNKYVYLENGIVKSIQK